VRLRDDRWHPDVQRLIDEIESIFAEQEQARRTDAPRRRPLLSIGTSISAVVALALILVLAYAISKGNGSSGPPPRQGGRDEPVMSAAAQRTPAASFSPVLGAAAQVHDLALGPDGSLYVLCPVFGGWLGVFKSRDGGATWAPPVPIPNSEFSNFGYSMTVAPDGRLHVVWWRSAPGGTETWYSASGDGGRTFSAPRTIRTGNPSADYRATNAIDPVVTADGDGRVYVVYSAYTKDSTDTFVGYNIWVSASTDGGASFRPELPVSTVSSTQKHPVRVRSAGSTLFVLYLDETNADLYFYRGGASQATTRVNKTSGKAQYGSDFVTAPDGGTVYVAFSNMEGDSEGNIDVCRSTDGGTTWSRCTRVNDNPYRWQTQPALALDRSGALHVVWTDLRSNLKFQIYYAKSVDSGASFSANVDLSMPQKEAEFTMPHVAVDDQASVLYVSATRETVQVMMARRPR